MHPKLKTTNERRATPARERRATTKQNAYIYNNNKRKEILCKCVSKCLSWFDKILHSEWLRLVEFGSLVRRLLPVTTSAPYSLWHFFYYITWISILFVLWHLNQSNLFFSCIRYKMLSFYIVPFLIFKFSEWCSWFYVYFWLVSLA